MVALVVILTRRGWGQAWGSMRGSLPTEGRWLWCVSGALVACSLSIGFMAAPNNWDALDYHLPRQLMWIAQGSVRHFPAWDVRMTAMPPFAEFAGTHLMLLCGSDACANIVQWMGLAGTGLCVALIAVEIGVDDRGAGLAALLWVATPIALMQSMNVKNDLVSAFFLSSLVLIGGRAWRERRFGWGAAWFAGASAGLLVLTKGTGLIFAPIGLLYVCAAGARAARWRAVLSMACAGLLCAAINGSHWMRNEAWFGSAIGATEGEGKNSWGVANETHSPAAIASNIVRNISMHLASPWNELNVRVERGVERWHRRLGIGVDDARTTYLPPPQGFGVRWRPGWEDSATAPVQLLAGMAGVAAGLVASWRSRIHALVVVACVAAFCAALKWQPWHPRLHLPMFAVALPLAPLVFSRLAGRVMMGASASGLGVLSIAMSETRPMLGGWSVWRGDRTSQMFAERRELLGASVEVAGLVAGLKASCVGLYCGIDAPLYSLMRLCAMSSPEARVVYFRWNAGHAGSRRYPNPDVIVGTDRRFDAVLDSEAGMIFRKYRDVPPYRVFVSDAKLKEIEHAAR